MRGEDHFQIPLWVVADFHEFTHKQGVENNPVRICPTLISNSQRSLNLVRLLIEQTQELYPNQEDGSDRLILVLRIYEGDLIRIIDGRLATLDELAHLKQGVREAGALLEDLILN